MDELRGWGRALGFDAVGISSTDLDNAWAGLDAWLAAGKHGAMDYMARHGSKRTRPNELVPGTRSIITVRMNVAPNLRPQVAANRPVAISTKG